MHQKTVTAKHENSDESFLRVNERSLLFLLRQCRIKLKIGVDDSVDGCPADPGLFMFPYISEPGRSCISSLHGGTSKHVRSTSTSKYRIHER